MPKVRLVKGAKASIFEHAKDLSYDVLYSVANTACIVAIKEIIIHCYDSAFAVTPVSQEFGDVRDRPCKRKSNDDDDRLPSLNLDCCHMACQQNGK